MNKWQQPIYIGKDSGKGVAICKVLDTDMATGNITVFNRETKRVEIVPYKEKRTLYENIHKLAVNTQELDCGY